MRHRCYFLLTLVVLAGLAAFFVQQGRFMAQSAAPLSRHQPALQADGGAYLYYTIRQAEGYVLARAAKGSNGQPLSAPQPLAQFGNGFGLLESDAVFFMQLSPDNRYLAIDGARDHGEQVWIYDIQRMLLTLIPANVLGNFLHWLPGNASHIFLYRPMFPLGPGVPEGANGWHPGIWMVDAATGAYTNIDIHMPSAFLIDAAPSPDGTRIVYSTSSGLGRGSDTWIMRSGDSNLTHLFSLPGGAQSIAGMFAWSPNGSSVAYERLSDGPTPFLQAALWLMNGDGMQQRRLADTDGGHGFALSWSPDGRHIAYEVRTNATDRRADLNMQSLQSAIAVVDTTSGHSWMVATPAQTGMQINANPQWIANGDTLTFTAYNPFNRVLGGTPRYWSAQVGAGQGQPLLIPLTPALAHVVAIGS